MLLDDKAPAETRAIGLLWVAIGNGMWRLETISRTLRALRALTSLVPAPLRFADRRRS